MGVICNLGKSLPYAAFFRWNSGLWVKILGAIILLCGVPASVCALTR
jgi:hypothetical protein